MSSSVKLSEIFWRAANEQLLRHSVGYSCWAVTDAIAEATPWVTLQEDQSEVALDFMEHLGCPIESPNAFNEFNPGQERQGARYAWLMFVSMYAEELGL